MHLIKPGTLLMAMNPTLPPVQYVNEKGELQGMHVELGNAVAEWLELVPVYQRVEFAVQNARRLASSWPMAIR